MYFPSILAPTFPNRIFQLCGQTDRLDDSIALCSYPTIFNHCTAAGVSSKYYYGNVPFLTLFPVDAILYANSFSDFLSDCANGSLPQVSFVDPSFTLVLNTANDNHPHSDIRNGDAFMAQVYQAVASSPDWKSTVLVHNYDEWGGFFEHVPPPRALAPNDTDPDLVDGEGAAGLPRTVHRGIALDCRRAREPHGKSHGVRSYLGAEDDRIRFQRAAAGGARNLRRRGQPAFR